MVIFDPLETFDQNIGTAGIKLHKTAILLTFTPQS